MDFNKIFYILIQGFVLGAGPCLLICAPILLPYIAGTKRSLYEGFLATLIFSGTRLVIYTLLGAASGLFGAFLVKLFMATPFSFYLWSAGAAFIIILGILIIMGKREDIGLCRFLTEQTLEDSTKSMIILGTLVGLSPCLPLIGILTEIALLSEHIYIGAIYGFAFGIGTVISPLLLLGSITPLIPQKLIRGDFGNRIFSLLCGGLLILVGIYIIFLRVGPS